MRNVLGSAIALAWCVALPAAEQQPSPTANPPAHNVFVATGCLKAPVGPAAAFTLTDASSTGRAASSRGAETGAVGTAGLKTSYELQPAVGVSEQGMDADALKAHAGRRVEVTLRPIEPVAAPAPAANLGVQPGKPNDVPPQRFSVSAIKRVTGSCS